MVWNWGQGTASGKVKATYARKVTRTIDGNDVTRNGNEEDKALLIEQEDGQEVLKLTSEVARSDR